MIKRMWKKMRSKHSDGSPSDTKKWKDWTDALMRVEELPDWDGFLPWDCTPLGELRVMMKYFEQQRGSFPAIARYIGDRIEAPPFEYHSLNVRSNSIRLLRFDLNTPYLPAPNQSCLLVELCMKHFPSDECPEYRALSYVWGSSSREVPILVNEKIISITQNLLIILSQLRRKNFEGWIWIDAVCIDQGNNLEKSLLLQRIPSIYKGAEATLAWVGEYEECEECHGSQSRDSLLCIARIGMIVQEVIGLPTADQIHKEDGNDSLSTLNQIKSNDLMMLLSTKQDLLTKTMLRIVEILTGKDKECSRKLEEVLSHPIWTRIWIVQEFASSRDVVLVNEEQTLELRTFFNVWAVLYHGLNQDANFDLDLLSSKIRARIKSMAPMLLLSNALGISRKPRSLFELTSFPACRETLRAEKKKRYFDFEHLKFHTTL